MLEAYVFPDSLILDRGGVSCGLIYFDRLFASETSGSGDDSTLRNLIKNPALPGLTDSETALRIYQAQRDLAAHAQVLEREGVLSRAAAVSVSDLPLVGRMLAAVNARENELVSVTEAAPRATWVNRGDRFSFHDEYLIKNEYVNQAVNALVRAENMGCELVTNTIPDFRSLIEVQTLSSGAEVAVRGPAPLQLIRLSMPRIIAKGPHEALRLREKLQDQLTPFRTEITRIAADLTAHIDPSALLLDAQSRIDRDVRPVVAELQRRLRDDLLEGLVLESKALLTTSVTFAIAILTDKPLPVAAAAAAGTLVPPIGNALVRTAMDRRKRKRSPFMFLLLAEESQV